MLFITRVFAYSILPLLIAAGHLALDRQARTTARRIEIFMLYLFAVSVGANGLSGAFGHLFLSDTIAESVGWPAGSPFQLEMGFANLAVGMLGIMAISRLDGFRTAAILTTTIIGGGATIVHLIDIVEAGNLAPGNTLQNISNLLDPILLIGLSWLGRRAADPDAGSRSFMAWQQRQQPIAGFVAGGVGMGFGVGYAVGGLFLWTLIGALLGVGTGVWVSSRMPQPERPLSIEP